MSTWNNSMQYSSDDMLRMQRDAIQRVQEMQRRAQDKVNQTNREEPTLVTSSYSSPRQTVPQPQQPFQGTPVQNHVHKQTPPAPSQNRPSQGILGGLLGGGLGDTVNNISELPKKAFSSISSILGEFGLDNEKIILIVLIFLLANEEGDKTLLLALGYLLFF